MASKKNRDDNNKNKKTFMSFFFSRQEPDEDYLPDLKSQWQKLDKREKITFVLGGIAGLILFIGSLVLVYLVIAAIVR